MNLIIAGGSGLIGRALCAALSGDGHTITLLSRRPNALHAGFPAGVNIVPWDGETRGSWEHTLSSADGVVNLCGAPIADGRWTSARKRRLRFSRIQPTRLLVEALADIEQARRPRVLVNSSGVGYYGPGDGPVTESSPIGSGFLAELASAWERHAEFAERLGVRTILLRTGLVLARQGGALPRMALPFRVWLGGPLGPGNQWVSWIHIDDLVALVRFALTDRAVRGPVNAVAPEAVQMETFCRTLAHVLGKPCWLPVPAVLVHAALGELATVMTTGQRAIPAAALKAGFHFRYQNLADALRNLIGRSGPSDTGAP
jgi:uncharacterized protein